MAASRRGALIGLALAVALLLSFHGAASAGNLGVSPTVLDLGARDTSTTIRIENLAADDVRVEVKPFVWRAGPAGEIVLAPAPDVVVFPRILTVGALDNREVRVGLLRPRGPGEGDYRIVVTELAPAAQANSVGLRAQFTVPLFVDGAAPAHAQTSIRVGRQDRKEIATIENAGNVHVYVQKIALTATDANRNVVFTTTLAGWWMLPGQTRSYPFDVPPQACKSAVTFVAGLTVGEVRQPDVAVPIGSVCGG